MSTQPAFQPVVFQVIQGHHMPFTTGQGDRVQHKQKAYMHNGGPFPVEVVFRLRAPVDARPVGSYVPLPTAYRAGKYGSPELNEWELVYNLAPVEVAK